MRGLRAILGGIVAVGLAFSACAEEAGGPAVPLAPLQSPPFAAGDLPVPPLLRNEATLLRHADLAELLPVSRPLAMVRHPVVVQSGAPLRPVVRIDYTPPARWDALASGEDWTEAAVAAVRATPHDLADVLPQDIAAWCPGYGRNPRHLREAFWVGLMSALARHESTFNPRAVGGGGLWHGLLQIYPPTARHFGCGATTAEGLHDPAANLACAARIMSVTVRRDQAVALHDGRWRGVAADWGPMTQERKREDIRQWVSTQDYCVSTESGAVRVTMLPESRPWADPQTDQLAFLSASTRGAVE